MGLFDKLFGRKKPVAPSAGELARERLTLMLVHDRLKLTPDLLGRIKEELLEVISKYVEIDETGVDIELTHSEHSDKLVARMPVRRQRLQFQRDVLEPGMGNPLAAAEALAKIHQPPADSASAPAESSAEAAAPAEQAQTSPESAPASAPEATENPAAPAASAPDVPAPGASPAGEQGDPAGETQPQAAASAPAATNGTNTAAGEGPAPSAPEAAGGATTETPAPAATPTKG